jgi:transporter family protein
MVYFLAFIGMVCWGISPLFAKIGLKDINPLDGLSIRTLFTSVVLILWMLLSGRVEGLKNIPTHTLLLLILEAIFATVIGDLAYFAALKKGSASIVMLIMSCSPVVTILCSVLFLNEKLTITNLIGACLTMVGLILVL